MTKDEFRNFLAERVKAHWDSLQSPYLLADIPSDFKAAKELDYKSVLGEQRLKAFFEELPVDTRYQLVKHPVQIAKIGLVPSGVDFEFPSIEDNQIKSVDSLRTSSSGKTKHATIAFLEAVARLPEQDQNEIHIPVRIIARLLSRD